MKTLNDYSEFLLTLELRQGPKIPHTKGGRLRGYRTRIEYVVRLTKTTGEKAEFTNWAVVNLEELAKFNTLQEAQMYCHWILTNPNRYYELQDLAKYPKRDNMKDIFLMRSDWENIFEVHTRETLPPKKLPERKEVEELAKPPQEVLDQAAEAFEEELEKVASSNLEAMPAPCSPKPSITLKEFLTVTEEGLERLKQLKGGKENLTEAELNELRELVLDTSPENKELRRKRKNELFRLAYSRRST